MFPFFFFWFFYIIVVGVSYGEGGDVNCFKLHIYFFLLIL